MKRIKVLGNVLKRTRADKIIIGFIVFIFAIAAVIQLVEPDINRYGDALWYCYAVISTAGLDTCARCRIWRCGCGYFYWKNVFRSSDDLFAFCSCHRHRGSG